MKRAFGALALITLYLVAALAPLALLVAGTGAPRRPFLIELSVALGFVGLSLMGLQFGLVARFKSVGAPFGIDVLVRFHREVSFLALTFVLAHPILLIVQNSARYLPLLLIGSAPWRARFAVASVALLLALIALSVWRRLLRIPYELWQFTHGLLALAVVVLAVAHIEGVGYYTSGVARRLVFDAMAAVLIGLLVWTRFVTPLTQVRRPWRVVRVRQERARSTTLVMEPVGHAGFTFRPGQFAWLSWRPLAIAQHPFSFSSPSDDEHGGRLAMTVKALGGWSRRVKSLRPGSRVYLDGPHGVFSMDFHQAPGYVFIAGGVGITPLFSMIGTMCVREDVRPVTLIYASQDCESIIFREQLDELAADLPNLRVVHVLRNPPPGWEGEQGRITIDVLCRHLPPRQYQRFEYFVCGPDSLMDTMEMALAEIGVPEDRVHTERFAVV
jgi:predicted ferric reductase